MSPDEYKTPVLRAMSSPGRGSKIYRTPVMELTIQCVSSDVGALSTTRISIGLLVNAESELRQRFRNSGRSRVQITTDVVISGGFSITYFSFSLFSGKVISIKELRSARPACDWFPGIPLWGALLLPLIR